MSSTHESRVDAAADAFASLDVPVLRPDGARPYDLVAEVDGLFLRVAVMVAVGATAETVWFHPGPVAEARRPDGAPSAVHYVAVHDAARETVTLAHVDEMTAGDGLAAVPARSLESRLSTVVS